MDKLLNRKGPRKGNALTKTKNLMCPRYEDPVGDDINEVEPPLGWNELTKNEKLDILDYEMDLYWKELNQPINWWQISTLILAFTNMIILFTL
jgi:hypothetical protein|uniref:Uncharacterized protein n=1 Tax=viral metagenome TaxID=1070528 RepID=A0A6C0AUC7_9ZZZZ|tara:strand:+ start:22097 stop:22375 length:279 start_codon:yes stop_codon:yes gene_type:complete